MSANQYPVWDPFTSKADKGISKMDWNVRQIRKFLTVKPNAKPGQVLAWLENQTIHPVNPYPAKADYIRKILKRASEGSTPAKRAPKRKLEPNELSRKKRKVETSDPSSIRRTVRECSENNIE